jgi:hypothetical protein
VLEEEVDLSIFESSIMLIIMMAGAVEAFYSLCYPLKILILIIKNKGNKKGMS